MRIDTALLTPGQTFSDASDRDDHAGGPWLCAGEPVEVEHPAGSGVTHWEVPAIYAHGDGTVETVHVGHDVEATA